MKKFIVALAISALLPLTALNGTVQAKGKNDDAAAAIAGIIALGVLGAAISRNQRKQGVEEYRPHPKIRYDENAVGACLFRAESLVRGAGGSTAQLNSVKNIQLANNGDTIVTMTATGVYPAGSKTSDIYCVVGNDHRVRDFRFN
ncbi:MAG: hypothetical protein L3J32_09150 [Rhizobiaceae bacterium]|nr:hypothetical protein [Rhizobiaceae bacterium]